LANNSSQPIASRTTRFSPSHLWLLTIGGFYTFFVFGFVDNLKGPTLPEMLRDLNLSYGEGGTILFSGYIGFMVATLLMGILADTLGNKTVLLLAGICLTIGLTAFSVASGFWLLALALFITGLGLGSIEVGGNALIVSLHGHDRGRYLNLLAVFHGVGALVVPLFAAQLLRNDFSWRQVYQLSIGLAVAMALFFTLVKYPHQAPAAGEGLNLRTFFATGFTRHMTWYYLLVTAYVAAEIGIAAWIVEFLQQVKGFSVETSSIYLSLFFAAIMAGRFAGSFVVERIGYVKVMLGATLLAIVCLATGIFGPPALTFFLPLTGLFFSIMFPTTTAAVSALHVENQGAILGVLFTFGGLGGAIGPWAVGAAGDWVGIEQAFAVSLVFCAIMLFALLMLRRPR
jgi:MFS transporter, FHS family, glucose/mannose:H+ symporter